MSALANVPELPRKVSTLEAALLAVLAVNHPLPVDAIDMFAVLWQMKRINASGMGEGMKLMAIAVCNLEERGYAQQKDSGTHIYYSLSVSGAAMIAGDEDINFALGLHALMGADRFTGGKPC